MHWTASWMWISSDSCLSVDPVRTREMMVGFLMASVRTVLPVWHWVMLLVPLARRPGRQYDVRSGCRPPEHHERSTKLTSKLFRAGRPSVSSRTERWVNRGKMISQTRSLVSSSSMNSSKCVNSYPPDSLVSGTSGS